MPQNGLCVDSRCDGEIRRLYECHCCSQFICLTHLIEHEEKEKFHSLTKQLRTNIDWIQLSIENRLKRIEEETMFVQRERKYLQQANQFLDGRSYPIEDIQKILLDFDQLVQSHSLQESVVKIEPFLFDVTNCSSSFQSLNHQNECSLGMIPSESKSLIRLDLTGNSDEKDKDQTNEEMECSTSLVQNISMNLSENCLQENDEGRIHGYKSVMGYCPLTSNGVYGFSREKHSIDLCSDGKHRRIGLYYHLKHKHKLKSIIARRLIDSIAKNEDPMTTKLFDDDEDVIDHSARIECPFKRGMIRLFDCEKNKSIKGVPCTSQSIATHSLKFHLKQHHHLSEGIAAKIVQHCKDNRTETDRFEL